MTSPFGEVHPLDAADVPVSDLAHAPAADSAEWLAIVDGIAADVLALAVAGDLRAAVGQAFEVCLLPGVATDRLILQWTDAVLRHLGLDVYEGPPPVARLELQLLDDESGLGTLTAAERWTLQLMRAQASAEQHAVDQLLARTAGAGAQIVYGERLLAVLLAAAATLRHPPAGRPS